MTKSSITLLSKAEEAKDGLMPGQPKWVYEAMKIHALAFVKWKDENQWIVDNQEQHSHTDEELHKLFNEEK